MHNYFFQVKTNSTDPFKNENNVTLNLNIPASLSGYVLEGIDLKYIKLNKKKPKSNSLSNLFIKYFTNRSTNLHLSSVTKEDNVKPNYFPYVDMNNRRDDEFSKYSGADGNSLVRPFRYQHKYPLHLLEKIRTASSKRENQRRARKVPGAFVKDVTNNFEEDDTRSRRSSQEDKDEYESIDLTALESILVGKSVSKNNGMLKDENRNLEIPELESIFKKAIGATIKEKPVETKKTEERVQQSTSKIVNRSFNNGNSWFKNSFPKYLLSFLPQSVQSTMTSGTSLLRRQRRSASIENTEASSGVRNKKSKYSHSKLLERRENFQVSPKSFIDPRASSSSVTFRDPMWPTYGEFDSKPLTRHAVFYLFS